MQVEVVAGQKRTALLNNIDVFNISFNIWAFCTHNIFLCISIKISSSIFVGHFVQ